MPHCANERRKETLSDSIEEFIAKAREVHGDKYSYDKVVYNGDKEKVIITFQKHGDFPQNQETTSHGKAVQLAINLILKSKQGFY